MYRFGWISSLIIGYKVSSFWTADHDFESASTCLYLLSFLFYLFFFHFYTKIHFFSLFDLFTSYALCYILNCWFRNYFKVKTAIFKESLMNHTLIHCFLCSLNVSWWIGASVFVVKQPNVALHSKRSVWTIVLTVCSIILIPAWPWTVSSIKTRRTAYQ